MVSMRPEKYLVRDRETCGNKAYYECDTMKEAREKIAMLTTVDVRSGNYVPFSYEIVGIYEYEGDLDGVAHCWKYVDEVDGGGVVV